MSEFSSLQNLESQSKENQVELFSSHLRELKKAYKNVLKLL